MLRLPINILGYFYGKKAAFLADLSDPKPWMKFPGCLAASAEMQVELKRIGKIIEDDFRQIDGSLERQVYEMTPQEIKPLFGP